MHKPTINLLKKPILANPVLRVQGLGFRYEGLGSIQLEFEAVEAEVEFNINLPKAPCNAAVAAAPSVAAGSSAAALYAAAASAAVAGPASSE